MIEIFRNWTFNIATIIVFFVLIEVIIPSEKFKKYIKFVIGLIIMIVIMNPIVSTLNGKISIDDIAIESFNQFQVEEIKSKHANYEKSQNDQILSIFKEKLIEQIKEKILSIDGINETYVEINIEEDVNSADFGEIKQINAEIHPNSNKELSKNETVKPVDINLEKKVSNNESNNQKLISKVKLELSTSYEIEPKNIFLKLQ